MILKLVILNYLCKNEYVEITVKLVRDINFRKYIINKINKLYNNDKPIKFHEDFILKKFL